MKCNFFTFFCRISLVVIFCAVGMSIASDSLQTDPSELNSILIKNIRLIDREGTTEDQTVTILIKNKRLDIITKDEIPDDEADVAIDARQGILLGNLEIGAECSFLILDQDPRENFDVLLDTNVHAQFAMREGMIVRNNYFPPPPPPEPVVEEKPEKKKQEWFSYTPPPIALPVSYQSGSKKWNRFETDRFSGTFFGALAMDRQYWVSQDEQSEQQVGDLKDSEGGEIRGLRFGFVGAVKFERPWIYLISGATNAFDQGFDSDEDDDLTLYDFRLDVPLTSNLTLGVGKQKEPISMERNMGLIYLPWQERAAVSDAMMPSRNVGLVLSGSGVNQRMSWATGVFNDYLDTGDSFNDGDNQIVGRLTGLPFLSEDESNLMHLGFGARYTDAKEGLRYFSRPEFYTSPTFVDTGLFEADHALTYNLEAAWRGGPLWISGEYTLNNVDSSSAGDPTFEGYFVSASYILTGEMRGYNKRTGLFNPIFVSKSVNQGGWGAWEIAGRYSNIDLTDGNIDGGRMDIYSLGLNWWLTQTASFGINYRHVELDRFGSEGRSDGIMSRITLILE